MANSILLILNNVSHVNISANPPTRGKGEISKERKTQPAAPPSQYKVFFHNQYREQRKKNAPQTTPSKRRKVASPGEDDDDEMNGYIIHIGASGI